MCSNLKALLSSQAVIRPLLSTLLPVETKRKLALMKSSADTLTRIPGEPQWVQGLLLATAAVQWEVGNLPCGFLQKPQGSWKRHVSPHSDSCLVWFVRPAECHQMALLVPPACTGSSHPTRTGAKMVLNEGAEHRCSPPGWQQSLMTQDVSKHFPKIVLRISDKSHICFVFCYHLPDYVST